jgi:tetratricopeptide (TPR) repeat protein
MPKTGSEVDHTAITDHRIPRRAEAPTKPPEQQHPGPEDLVPFQADQLDPGDEEVKRNLGIALVKMVSLAPPEDVKRRFGLKALPLLERAVERDRTDVPAWEAKGTALWALERREEALAAFEEVLAQRPDAETTLHGAGNLALDMNRPGKARAYFERAVRINPWRWEYRLGLAKASFRLAEWDRAVDECREALRLEPANSASRSLLIQCHLATGRREKAEEQFKVLRQITLKGRRPALQRWYETVKQRLGPGRP